MSTLAACACVCRMCVSICVFVLAYCGLPRNIVSKFTNFLCIYVRGGMRPSHVPG